MFANMNQLRHRAVTDEIRAALAMEREAKKSQPPEYKLKVPNAVGLTHWEVEGRYHRFWKVHYRLYDAEFCTFR